jgi:hypothetical protein
MASEPIICDECDRSISLIDGTTDRPCDKCGTWTRAQVMEKISRIMADPHSEPIDDTDLGRP